MSLTTTQSTSASGRPTSSSDRQDGGGTLQPLTVSAADALAANASGLERAGELLDPAALSELLGQQVRITHVRSKPDRSLLVAHTDSRGEAGWTMLTVDPVKYHNAQERAEGFGRRIQVHSTAGPHLFSGSVWSDPQLAKELTEARAVLGEDVSWQILRYNPRRRVVATLRSGSSQKVVRVLASGADHLRQTTRHWRGLGLPVSNVSALGQRSTAVIAPMWGVSDLHSSPHPPAAVTAGAAVAALHAAPPRRSAANCAHPDPQRAAAGLGQVAPWAQQRATTLAERLAERLAPLGSSTAAEIHGDLSPDQVVLAAHGSHKIRLIDLDRAGSGHPMRDVGSWVAACRRNEQTELIDAFLTGYTEHAPAEPDDMHAWEAYAHLAGAADFFRHRETDWPAHTVRALDLTEEALNR
ncbi:phosphotransferase [Garicola koreensis]|uniref:Aminoglycoside phosphotransferase domain-containing protein n=1 Tax=Garicola koreensis TaxID=1262554 RepID=A0A7W5TS83_9MICC|nr:phosphotransferase [Garicola koreensis]MBB3667707.1 hypothetical protein [Garicola koreensis]